MIRRMILVVPLLTCLIATPALSRSQAPSRDTSHDAWVFATLKQMTSIKVGMTRADVLKVFETRYGANNGVSHISGIAHNETFISRACPFFKVDVEFADVAPFDVIIKISRPYVEPQLTLD